jgi:hypothetical protein
MIYIPELDLHISDVAEAAKDLKIQKYLRCNLDKGSCIIIIPERLDAISPDQKLRKKSYKVGFLFEALGTIYPGTEKQAKHKIIDQKYHMFITYRQFFTLLDFYESNREKFYSKNGFK